MSAGLLQLSPGSGGLGGTIGNGVGTWVGRGVGGLVGELFGPEAVPLGVYLGGKAGGYLGQVAGDYVEQHMSSANDQADQAAKGNQKTACATCAKRSKPNQTCDDDRLNELESAKDQLQKEMFTNPAFKSGNEKKLAMVSCSDLQQRISGMKALRDARQQIQDECFKGNPDPGHDEAIKQLDQGIANMTARAAVVCGGQGVS